MRDKMEDRLMRAFTKERIDVSPETEKARAVIVDSVRKWRDGRGTRQRIGFWRLMLCQVRFIGWRIWLWEAALTAFGAAAAKTVLGESYFTVRRAAFLTSSLGVMISMILAPFVYRSVRYGMMEIETASYFSAKRLLLCRAVLVFAGEAALMAGLLSGGRMYGALGRETVFGWAVLSLGLGWSGAVRVIRKAKTQEICGCYLRFCGAALGILAAVFKWMPWVFDGVSSGVFAVCAGALTAYCGYEGVWIVKRGEAVA